MKTGTPARRSSIGLIAAVAISLIVPSPLASQTPAPSIRPPVRRAPAPPTVPPPPDVPPFADTLAPMTSTVTTRWEEPGREPRTMRQTVLRTVERVLVATDGTQSEWLFERNPVDRRRVSGYLVDHKLTRILIHQESDLRNDQQIRGWMDAITLRFDTDGLKLLRATGETDTVNGVAFAHYVSPTKMDRGIVEVWWSEARLFARKVTTREGRTTITALVDSFQDGVDESRLVPPATRFPSYRILDVTDAREPL